MGYPGDQQPHRQPHLPSDQPRWRDAPPYEAADDASPYGSAGRRRREASPFEREQVQPYDERDDSTPYGTPEAPRREAPPYAGGRWRDEPTGGPGSGPGSSGIMDEPAHDRRSAAASVPPPPEPMWDPDAPVPLWRRPLVLGAALLALIGALFLGLWVAARGDKPVRTVTAPTPSPLVPSGPGGQYGYAGSRATDKAPLSARELFGKKKIGEGAQSYVMTVWRKEKSCADGITGEKIAKALRAGRCTQLIRASFKNSKGTIIGTVGVANLKTSAAAKKVASAGGGGERKDYLKPLPGKDDATKRLGTGEAYAGGWTQGHYAILLWFQFKDGHKPSKPELKRLYQAAVDITDKTVFPALDTRALTGNRG
ncbi:hypothetical protein N5079_00225 [Planotetraspora sp. A-T 1434]|uniref:hypothetical protein n=1 Tax=Planotetraspora sp. A-T 1434 TaxID=2979219 RepID=UPI0021BFCC42|nr:hypothetical protein [Planotetraspora sp. A-T 1434]MCT9928635.1 hypothetical protein [Planotetraspora sp. A-T 1434]